MEEGMLTKIRARIISDRSLADLSLKMGLDEFVRVSKSEIAVGGQKRPALLSDTFEAILGAMFLDKGAEYVQDWMTEIIETHMTNYLQVDFIVDHKTFLQEIVQRTGDPLPNYECLEMKGPEHKKTFFYEVTVSIEGKSFSAIGEGQNKKTAQQVAAKVCVQILRENNIISN
jgi:ribonuclease-3